MGVSIWEGAKAQALIDAINGLPNATQEAADAALQAATYAERVNVSQSKSGKVVSVTTTNRNNQQTTTQMTDPAGMVAEDFDATKDYSAGDYAVYNGDLYRFSADHPAGAWTGTDAEVATIASAIEDKAESHGTFSELTAGSAEQLLSSTGVEDKVPYAFRQTGGGVDVGTRVDEEIVGGTIVWNQLIPTTASSVTQEDISFINNGDGSWTVSGTTTQTNFVNLNYASGVNTLYPNHVYAVIGIHDNVKVNAFTGMPSESVFYVTEEKIVKPSFTPGTVSWARLQVSSGVTVNTTVKPQIFDLTQMFGTAVADYIYNLETATAGAGVAWFKKLFPADYYAYNAGELMSVNTAAHKTVGFNVWDEEWEAGGISSTDGQNTNTANVIRTKNYIPVIPGTRYYFSGTNGDSNYLQLRIYGSDKSFITTAQAFLGNGVTPLAGMCYFRWMYHATYGTSYKNDTCLNIYNASRNGEYEPYKGHSYPLDSALTLRGVPKLDSANKLYYDGDIYSADGSVKRRYGVVDMGTLGWSYVTSETNPLFRVEITNKLAGSSAIICRYPAYINRTYLDTVDKAIAPWNSTNSKVIAVRDSAYSTAADFKAAMSGAYLVYELETPTTETAEPYQQIQSVDPLGTEEYVDAGVAAGTRDVAVPVGHNSFYMTDLRKKIEGIPGDFSKLLAPIESGFTASKAYAANDFLIVNSQLYKVTASIANAATITPGTNVTATTVAEVLSALLNS